MKFPFQFSAQSMYKWGGSSGEEYFPVHRKTPPAKFLSDFIFRFPNASGPRCIPSALLKLKLAVQSILAFSRS